MTTWVQGQRAVADTTGLMPWPELLYRRVTRGFDHIPTGPTTAAAEAGLAIGANTYFYVERPHPHFGEAVVAFEDRRTSVSALVTPFDTGGLWNDHITTDPELGSKERRELIDRWSSPVPDYINTFEEWVGESFESTHEYRRGVKPTSDLIEEFDLSACSDQAWTWEARLRKGSGDNDSVDPVRVYLMDGRRSLYLSWLRNTGWLSADARRSHLEWFGRYVVESPNPVDEMMSYLKSTD